MSGARRLEASIVASALLHALVLGVALRGKHFTLRPPLIAIPVALVGGVGGGGGAASPASEPAPPPAPASAAPQAKPRRRPWRGGRRGRRLRRPRAEPRRVAPRATGSQRRVVAVAAATGAGATAAA